MSESPPANDDDMLTWEDGHRLVIGETTFQTLPPGNTPTDVTEGGRKLPGGDFFLFKPRALLERHVALINALRPQHVFELGFFRGGSTVFFAEVTRPRRLVAIDRRPLSEVRRRVENHAAARGLPDVVRTYGGVDQADRRRLAEIVDEAFDGDALDLVVDDCSHQYEPTRASFNELFPRLRPGGAYVIEDWRWAHTELGKEPLEGLFPDQTPLTRLLFEIVLAIPGVPDLVTEISIAPDAAIIRRGETRVDAGTFEISACSNPRGHALLA